MTLVLDRMKKDSFQEYFSTHGSQSLSLCRCWPALTPALCFSHSLVGKLTSGHWLISVSLTIWIFHVYLVCMILQKSLLIMVLSSFVDVWIGKHKLPTFRCHCQWFLSESCKPCILFPSRNEVFCSFFQSGLIL